eukprot:1026799-Prorocentrum_minimum.AAC.1
MVGIVLLVLPGYVAVAELFLITLQRQYQLIPLVLNRPPHHAHVLQPARGHPVSSVGINKSPVTGTGGPVVNTNKAGVS